MKTMAAPLPLLGPIGSSGERHVIRSATSCVIMSDADVPTRPTRSLAGRVCIVTGAGSEGDGIGGAESQAEHARRRY